MITLKPFERAYYTASNGIEYLVANYRGTVDVWEINEKKEPIKEIIPILEFRKEIMMNVKTI